MGTAPSSEFAQQDVHFRESLRGVSITLHGELLSVVSLTTNTAREAFVSEQTVPGLFARFGAIGNKDDHFGTLFER